MFFLFNAIAVLSQSFSAPAFSSSCKISISENRGSALFPIYDLLLIDLNTHTATFLHQFAEDVFLAQLDEQSVNVQYSANNSLALKLALDQDDPTAECRVRNMLNAETRLLLQNSQRQLQTNGIATGNICLDSCTSFTDCYNCSVNSACYWCGTNVCSIPQCLYAGYECFALF